MYAYKDISLGDVFMVGLFLNNLFFKNWVFFHWYILHFDHHMYMYIYMYIYFVYYIIYVPSLDSAYSQVRNQKKELPQAFWGKSRYPMFLV